MKQGNIMEALELWILNNFLFYCLMAAALVVSLSFVNSLPIGFLVLFTIVAIGFTLIYALNRRAEAKEKSKV